MNTPHPLPQHPNGLSAPVAATSITNLLSSIKDRLDDSVLPAEDLEGKSELELINRCVTLYAYHDELSMTVRDIDWYLSLWMLHINTLPVAAQVAANDVYSHFLANETLAFKATMSTMRKHISAVAMHIFVVDSTLHLLVPAKYRDPPLLRLAGQQAMMDAGPSSIHGEATNAYVSQVNAPNGQGQGPSAGPGQEPQSATPCTMNIPKFTLMVFDGSDPTLWKSYIESFEVTIDKSDLGDIQKMTHLVNSLKYPARLVVNGYTLSDANYPLAMRALKERYGEPRIQKKALLAKLDKWHYQAGKDPRILIDYLEKLLIQLQSEGEDINNHFKVNKIIGRLPFEIKKLLQRKRASLMGSSTTQWEIEPLQNELKSITIDQYELDQQQDPKSFAKSSGTSKKKSRVNVSMIDVGADINQTADPEVVFNLNDSDQEDILSDPDEELCMVVNNKKQTVTFGRPNNKRGSLPLSVSTPSLKTSYPSPSAPPLPKPARKAKFPCILCTQLHFSDQCPKYKTLSSRIDRFREENRCFCYGLTDHMVSKCPERKVKPCFVCKQPGHHRALCRKLFNVPFRPPNSKVTANAVKAEDTDYVDTFLDISSDSESSSDDNEVAHEAVNSVLEVLTDNSQIATLMLTAKAILRNPATGALAPVNVFLDSGSERSFLSAKVAERLELKGKKDLINLYTFANQDHFKTKTQVVSVELYLKDVNEWLSSDVNTLQHMITPLTTPPLL